MNEIAVFGGAFNPPTTAHAAVIDACLRLEPINEVWVMPSGDRLDKRFSVAESARVKMIRLMLDETFRDTDRVKLCRFELDHLPKPSQTYRTVEALSRELPSKNFRYVFGSDSYASMPSWQEGERLQHTLPMIVVARGESCHIERPNVMTVEPMRADYLSSTQVRERVARGEAIENFVCSSVARYIEEAGLYKQEVYEVQ